MADTRTANPEYQLDVDVLILEYTVYKAVQIHLKALGLQINDIGEDEDDVPDRLGAKTKESMLEAQSSLENLDILISAFHRNYPSVDFSEGCAYNLKILSFLTLLGHWLPRSTRTQLGEKTQWQFPGNFRPAYHCPAPLPEWLIQYITRERVANTVLRRLWLDHRLEANGLSEIVLPYSRFRVGVHGSQQQADRIEAAKKWGLFVINLFDLFPKFMSLSIAMVPAMGKVSDRWIELASNFLLQSCLERLLEIPAAPEDDGTADVRKISATVKGQFLWIEECFAWGAAGRPSRLPLERVRKEISRLGRQTGMMSDVELQERLRLEDLACALFNDNIDHQAEEEEIMAALDALSHAQAMKQERTNWAKARDDHKDRIIAAAFVPGTERRLVALENLEEMQQLCQKHSIGDFVKDLLHFIEGCWNCNASSDMNSKPVLVQIEEGGLDGMDTAEFERFLGRVGLRVKKVRGGDGEILCQVCWAR